MDDHDLVLDALSGQLGLEPDFEVVGVAQDLEAALALSASRPHLLLCDVAMPDLSTFDLGQAFLARSPDTRLVYLTAFPTEAHTRGAARAGASGFLTKDQPYADLTAALRAIAAGQLVISPSVHDRLHIVDGRLCAPEPTESVLTPREMDVLRRIALGLAKKEIATQCGISVRTVDTHVRNLMNKLDLHDRVELARYAIREHLVEP